MDVICPYLALATDRRAVSEEPSPEHRCYGETPPTLLERTYQARYCLSSAHAECPIYLAVAARAEEPSPFVSTRVVVAGGGNWGRLRRRPRRRIWVGVAAVALLLVTIGAAWAFGGGPFAPPTASPTPTAIPTATPSPSPSPSTNATIPATPTVVPSVSSAPTPTVAPSPTPLTYVVQAGDTLNAIATRFGTTAQAIREANGLTGDLINVGQVLIIPQ